MWKVTERCPRIEVNERGEVRYTGSGKLASTSVAATGYIQVGVWYKGKPRTYNVHRLVAEAFIPNPHNLPQINHKDENRANCDVSNLEWCTSKYNNNYGHHIERLREHGCIPVVGISVDTGERISFKSLEEAGRYFGKNPVNIRACIHGRSKTALGYTWELDRGCA